MMTTIIAKVVTIGDSITLMLCLAFLAIAVPFMIIALLQKRFKSTWFCDKMGWHLQPATIGFDGCSNTGTCPRCNESVMQDSQGNWF